MVNRWKQNNMMRGQPEERTGAIANLKFFVIIVEEQKWGRSCWINQQFNQFPLAAQLPLCVTSCCLWEIWIGLLNLGGTDIWNSFSHLATIQSQLWFIVSKLVIIYILWQVKLFLSLKLRGWCEWCAWCACRACVNACAWLDQGVICCVGYGCVLSIE